MLRGAVILVAARGSAWSSPIGALLGAHGYRIAEIQTLSMLPYLLLSGGITALVADARAAAAAVDVLERCHRIAPAMRRVLVDGGGGEAVAAVPGPVVALRWPASDFDILRAVSGDQGDR
jgi:hypothetical protein